jgi:hypothetical protein
MNGLLGFWRGTPTCVKTTLLLKRQPASMPDPFPAQGGVAVLLGNQLMIFV